ncbi:MAG: putative protein-methionine-sulfoxide reductase subunit YedZ1 [Chroococcopsis gigantea SAG 12.99]|jgi:DMSO/TMAO reductase YedYZ molybdopterin-dependent catalytic subunit|nr:putative protein-methionine-sulfoxide reductase subunit YedZ1 [Chroococcopsis gigantea SAG 12.99]
MSSQRKSKLYLPRRQFLQLSGISTLGLFLGGCALDLFAYPVQLVAGPINEKVEGLLFNPQKLAPEFTDSAIEPDSLLINTFDFTPEIDPATFRLKIDGEVARPLSLSLGDIKNLPRTTMTVRHICVEGWSAIVQWGGIRLQEIAALAQPSANARYVYFQSADGYYESWDIASALHPQTLLAYEKNGEELPVENGAPLRLASPIKLGYKQSKWVTRVSFLSRKPTMLGYWEDQGYEWFAGL